MQSVSESVPASARTEIVFVDAGVEAYEAIIAGVAAGAEVVLIDSSADGLAQMVEALKGREAIDAIHVVSHGDAGRLLLGAATLSAGNLDFYADDLAAIGRTLAADGDIHLWGCDIGKSEEGRDFVQALAHATAADVAASDDLTGLLGDWELEVATGNVAASSAIAWNEDMPTLGTWTANDLKPNPPGDNYGEGQYSGESLGQSYEEGGFRFSWNGYAEEDSHGIAFGTHWEGQVGVDFVRSSFGDPNTQVTVESVDGSEFWLREFRLSNDATGSTEWTFTGYRDGEVVTPSITLDGLSAGDNYIQIADPSFGNVDKVVVTSVDPIRGLNFGIKHGEAVDGTLSAKLAPGDIAVIGVDSVVGDAAFVAVRDLPGDHFVFITTAGWNSSTGGWLNADMALLTSGGEALIAWKTPPGGVAAGTVFNLANMPGGVTEGSIYFNAGAEDPYPINDQLLIFDLADASSITTPNFVYAINVTDAATATDGFQDTYTAGDEYATWGESGVPDGLVAASDGGLGSAFGLAPDGSRTALKAGVLHDGMTEEEVLQAIHTSANWESASDWDGGYDFGTRFVSIEMAGPEAPTATNLTQTVAYTEDGGGVALDDIVVTDTDDGETITATLTLSNPAAGALSTGTFGSATSTFTAGTGVWTVTGSVADVNAALAAAALTPSANNDQSFTITTRIRDAAGTGPADGTISVTVTGVNDAPTATNLTQAKTATEGGSAVALDDIVVTDVDAGETVTATLTLSNPAAGALSTGTYGAATSTFNPGTGVWTVTGSVADVNAALATAALTPSANNDQNFTITTRIRDTAGTGPADGAISVTVTSVNDAPTAMNLTQSKTATEGGSAVALDDIVVTDVDAGETVTATLTLSNPTAGALSTGTYGSATSTFNPGTGVWTVTGSVADVNAALATAALTPSADNDQNFTITTRIRDAAGTGPADGTISVSVTSVNDAPTATNLTQVKSATEGGSAVALDDIVITDIDSGETITATLTLSDPAAGTLSTGTFGSATSTFNAGTGVWTVTGSTSDVNAALATAALTPSADNDQNFTIATRIRDAAGTGPVDGAISVTVTGVADAPSISAAPTLSAVEDTDLTIAAGDLNFADPDGDTLQSITITGLPGAGALTLDGVAIAEDQVISRADIDAGKLKFAPAADGFGDDYSSFTYTVSDGALSSAEATATIDVAAVNDAPTLDAAKGYVNTGAPTETGGRVVITSALLNEGDPDDDGTGVTYTITAATSEGALFLDADGDNVVDAGEGLVASSTFTQADIDLGRVKYQHGGGAGTADSFTFSTADGGEDGAVAVTGQAFSISVAERPFLTIGGGTPAHVEDGAATVVAPSLTITDADSPAMTGATVTITDLAAGDLLGFTNQNGIAGSFDAATGVLTLTGAATVAQYQAALRSVTYSTTNDNPATGAGNADRAIGFAVSDGGLESVEQIATVAVQNANDSPVLDASASPSLNGLSEDTAAPVNGSTAGSTLVSALTGGASDVDSGALQGVAVTGVSGAGTLWHSLDGGTTWDLTPSVSDTSALLLQSDARLYFQPGANVSGVIADALTFQAWDRTSGSNGGTADVSAPGGGSAFSVASDTVSISISAVNDAPTLASVSETLTATNEDTASPPASVAGLLTQLGLSDVDAGALGGAAITGLAGRGMWQYSTDGTDWHNVGAVGTSAALLLPDTAALRYIPDGANGETATLQLRAWDQTTGTPTDGAVRSTADVSTSGGTTAYSAAQASVSLAVNAVNDAPILSAVGSQVLAGTDEDTTAASVTVADLLSGAGHSEVDTAGLSGIAVTGASGAGTWEYSTDGTVWTSFGAVTGASALLLTDTTQVRFAPGGEVGGEAGLAFRAWDQTSGLGSAAGAPQKADTTTNGGATPFSAATASATLTVTDLNDLPAGALTIGGAARVGATLAVQDTLSDLDGLGPRSYQWQADGVDIVGANGATFALTSDHLGKAISVVASYTDGGGQVESVASSATAAVSNPPPPVDPPSPPSPPSTETIDGVVVGTQTGTASDGTPIQIITIPIVTPSREEQVGNNTVADIPLVTDASGTPLLQAEAPTGFGLQVSGSAAPKAAGNSLTDLIREIRAHTAAGSADQAQLTGGGSGFLQGLAGDTPLLVQTITPTVAPGADAPGEPLVIRGAAPDVGGPQTALVIDARGLPNGAPIQLQNVEFAALIGAVHVSGGQGAQHVWGDGASQHMVLGEGDDVLHGGAGDDTVGSQAGNDQLHGGEGQDVVFGGEGADFVHGNLGNDTVSGEAGEDLVFGGQGADVVHGNAGNDTVNGDVGQDVVYGGQGEDQVFGGADEDLLFGDLGDDILQGNAGADTLNGGAGADTVYGGQDRDAVLGGADSDLLFGDLGDDYVQGNAGHDTLQGGVGNDLLHGGRDDDVLLGGDGDDWLSGDFGDDVLTGGAGADVFMVLAEGGVDRVLDFNSAEGDRVHIDPKTTYAVSQQGADTVIDLGGGHRMILADVQLASLDEGWILGG